MMKKKTIWLPVVALCAAYFFLFSGDSNSPRQYNNQEEEVVDQWMQEMGYSVAENQVPSQASTHKKASFSQLRQKLKNKKMFRGKKTAAKTKNDKARGKVSKKVDKKKNKKKKKKVAKKKANKETNANFERPTRNAQRDIVTEAPASIPVGVGGFPIAEDEGDNQEEKTADELLSSLGSQPSFKKIDRLIQQYRSGAISKAVYFDVVRRLLDAKDQRSQLMGIRLAGSNVEAESFIVLSEVTLSGVSENVKNNARSYLINYENIRYIDLLADIIELQSLDPSIKLKALTKAEIARNKTQANGRLPLASESSNGNGLTEVEIANFQRFQQVVNQQARIEQNQELRIKYEQLANTFAQTLASI